MIEQKYEINIKQKDVKGSSNSIKLYSNYIKCKLDNIVRCKNQYQIPKTKASKKDFDGSRKVIGNLDKWRGFPDSSVSKESACNTGDPSSIPGSGRSTGEWIGYPL